MAMIVLRQLVLGLVIWRFEADDLGYSAIWQVAGRRHLAVALFCIVFVRYIGYASERVSGEDT